MGATILLLVYLGGLAAWPGGFWTGLIWPYELGAALARWTAKEILD